MLTFGHISGKGDRQVNEDSVGAGFFSEREEKVFVLCDGLGGHGYGDAASNIAKRAFLDTFTKYDGDAAAYFALAFGKAQADIVGAQEKNSGMSRTADHSVPQMLLKAGEITEDQIRFHPDRNKLLRALGDAENEPKYTASETVEARGETAFLLCSDGFWEHITEDIGLLDIIQYIHMLLNLKKVIILIHRDGSVFKPLKFTVHAVYHILS